MSAKSPTSANVREVLLRELAAQFASQGRAFDPSGISSHTDLLLSGIIDSLGLLEVAAGLSEYCGFEIDFSDLGPDELTVVGPLCDFVAAQAAERRS